MEGKEKDGKNKMMMLIIILLLIVTLGTIGGVSWYVLTRLGEEPEEVVMTPPPIVEPQLPELAVFSAGRITRNLLNLTPATTRGWMAVMEISFQIDTTRDPEGLLLELMEAQVDMIRDIIITIVGNYTYEQLNAPNGPDILREEIMIAVSEQLQTNLIVRVNFPMWQLGPV